MTQEEFFECRRSGSERHDSESDQVHHEWSELRAVDFAGDVVTVDHRVVDTAEPVESADLALCRTVPVLWLSRGRDNTTTVLDFTATADMIEQARVHSQTVLSAAAALPDLGPGLYGAGPELAVRSDIQALMR